MMERDALDQIQASMAHLTTAELLSVIADLEAHGVRSESTVMQACQGLLEKRQAGNHKRREVK